MIRRSSAELAFEFAQTRTATFARFNASQRVVDSSRHLGPVSSTVVYMFCRSCMPQAKVVLTTSLLHRRV